MTAPVSRSVEAVLTDPPPPVIVVPAPPVTPSAGTVIALVRNLRHQAVPILDLPGAEHTRLLEVAYSLEVSPAGACWLADETGTPALRLAPLAAAVVGALFEESADVDPVVTVRSGTLVRQLALTGYSDPLPAGLETTSVADAVLGEVLGLVLTLAEMPEDLWDVDTARTGRGLRGDSTAELLSIVTFDADSGAVGPTLLRGLFEEETVAGWLDGVLVLRVVAPGGELVAQLTWLG